MACSRCQFLGVMYAFFMLRWRVCGGRSSSFFWCFQIFIFPQKNTFFFNFLANCVAVWSTLPFPYTFSESPPKGLLGGPHVDRLQIGRLQAMGGHSGEWSDLNPGPRIFEIRQRDSADFRYMKRDMIFWRFALAPSHLQLIQLLKSVGMCSGPAN